MIRAAARIVVLVLISAGIGFGYARHRALPLVPDPEQINVEQDKYQLWVNQTAIGLEDFRHHYEGGGLVLDARPREQFEEGHLDAPLIMNVPAEEADKHLARIEPCRGHPIVLYCASETCDSAKILWDALQSVGLDGQVRVYHPGWRGIVAAGLPTIAGPDPNQETPPPESGNGATGSERGEPPAGPDSNPDQPGGG